MSMKAAVAMARLKVNIFADNAQAGLRELDRLCETPVIVVEP